MDDAIIFLGTGGDTGVITKLVRGCGGVVLRLSGNQFHLDPGPGALLLSYSSGVNPRETVALLLSQDHTYTANDINVMISAMTLDGLDPYGVLLTPQSVLSGGNVVITKDHQKMLERAVAFKPGSKVGINEVDITGVPLFLTGSDGVGYKFETKGACVSYTGNTAYSEHVATAHKGADFLIVNCRAPFGVNIDGTMNCDDVVELLKEVKPRLAVITGYGIEMHQSDPISQAREIQKQSGVQVLAAKDGLHVDLKDYLRL